MGTPLSVAGREVVCGAGVHGAVYAATRVAMGRPAPVILEKAESAGGIFARLVNFRMNSQQGASRESTAGGPSRVPSRSPSDDLNHLPNSAYQVRDESGAVEYPASKDMARAVRKTARAYGEVHENAVYTFNEAGDFYDAAGDYMGNALRVIWAAGLAMPAYGTPVGPAIISAYDFMRDPIRQGLASMRIAIRGGGDMAATVAEYLLGQGFTAPYELPSCIHWYGGPDMPVTKEAWMTEYHARYLGIARHLPQDGVQGVIRPYAELATVDSLGATAMVNGQVYDRVISATGFQPVAPPYDMGEFIRVSGIRVARHDGFKSYTIGAAASLPVDSDPYPSRFTAASQAIYRLAPLTAALAASLN